MKPGGSDTVDLDNGVTTSQKKSGFSVGSEKADCFLHFPMMAVSVIVPSCFPWLCRLHSRRRRPRRHLIADLSACGFNSYSLVGVYPVGLGRLLQFSPPAFSELKSGYRTPKLRFRAIAQSLLISVGRIIAPRLFWSYDIRLSLQQRHVKNHV